MQIPPLKDVISEAASNAGIDARKLEGKRARAILDALLEKYGADTRVEFTHDNIRQEEYAAVQHPDSWSWVDEFMSDEPVLFFYDSSLRDDDAMFRLPSGRDVIKILNGCYSFEYYVTNDTLDYVICQTDDDYIIGAGRAKAWVESLAPRHEAWVRSLRSQGSEG
jgi:hypothetical protein